MKPTKTTAKIEEEMIFKVGDIVKCVTENSNRGRIGQIVMIIDDFRFPYGIRFSAKGGVLPLKTSEIQLIIPSEDKRRLKKALF